MAAWHATKSDSSLAEWLGMMPDEYELFVYSVAALPIIVAARRRHQYLVLAPRRRWLTVYRWAHVYLDAFIVGVIVASLYFMRAEVRWYGWVTASALIALFTFISYKEYSRQAEWRE